MRPALNSLLLLGICLPLGGCAYLPLAPAVAEIVNSAAQGGGYANPDFRAAATEACIARASRHGRATVTNVQLQGPASAATSARVSGSVQSGISARTFGCTFSSNGTILDFDLSR